MRMIYINCRSTIKTDVWYAIQTRKNSLDGEKIGHWALTSLQFQSVINKLLIHSEITESESANAIALDSTAILHCSSASPIQVEDVATRSASGDLDEYYTNSNLWDLTLYCEDVIVYTAGFVVKNLKFISCSQWLSIIESGDIISKLQMRKTFGALTKASKFVIQFYKLIWKMFPNL